MTAFLITLHVVVCIALIVIVLLQMGKGAEAGASFGAGASQTILGASGGGSFMGKVTAGAAVIFMLTSLSLAYFYGSPESQTIMPSALSIPAQPLQEPAAIPAPSTAPSPVAPAEGK